MKKNGTIAVEPAPHIGQLIGQLFKKRRTFKSALSRELGVLPQTVLSYPKRASMQTETLWKLSWVLKHNFLKDLADQLPAEFSTFSVQDTSLQDRISALEKENEILQSQLAVLKEVMKQ